MPAALVVHTTILPPPSYLSRLIANTNDDAPTKSLSTGGMIPSDDSAPDIVIRGSHNNISPALRMTLFCSSFPTVRMVNHLYAVMEM